MTVTVAPIAFITLGRRAADLSETATCFISNPLHGQAHGITRIRRHRWHVEVSHEEGPVNGFEQDHVRDFEAIARHVPWGTCCHHIISIAHHNSSLRPHIRGWLVVKWEFDMLRSSAGVPFVVP
jgi:hypothetical protein